MTWAGANFQETEKSSSCPKKWSDKDSFLALSLSLSPSLSLPLSLCFSASINVGTFCSFVFTCQALDSLFNPISTSLRLCSFLPVFFLSVFLLLFSILTLPFRIFSVASLYFLSSICYLFLMSIRSSFIPQNELVSITLSQLSWFTHLLLSYLVYSVLRTFLFFFSFWYS